MNIGQMMKQVQDMQAKMADMQAKLETLLVEGQSGGGLVRVVMSGRHEVRRVEIEIGAPTPGDR